MSKTLKRALGVTATAATLCCTSLITSAPAYACADVNDCLATYATGPGALPGATDPDALVSDPVAIEAKYVRLANNAPTIATYLAVNALQPVPSDSAVDTTPPAEDAPPPPQGKVTVTGVAQGSRPWCVPAATATTLSAFTSSYPTVSALASEEKAQAQGTPFYNAVPALRKRVNRNYYFGDTADNAADLLDKTAGSIGQMAAPVITDVDTHQLDWWQSSSSQGFHALTIYLYHTNNGGGYSVWDSGWAARHSITSANMYKAIAPSGGALIW